MQIQQISVFVENKPGRLADITETLAQGQVNIRAVSVADTSDFGILRLIVDKPQEAVRTLREAGHTVSLTNVIAVCMEDTPGSFAKIMRVLADHGVTVEYMCAFNCRAGGRASVILKVSDAENSVAFLKKAQIEILEPETVYDM